MKRFIILTIIAVMAIGVAFAATFKVDNNVRWAGVNTTTGGTEWFGVDSTDTFLVDTAFSDTVTLDSLAKWLVVSYELDGYTVCDSCNDSMLAIITGYVAYNGHFVKEILTADTIPTTLGTLDSTMSEIMQYVSLDSTIANQFWFRTIIKDSVIIGNTNPDSIRFKLHYEVGQKAVEPTYQ